MNYRGYKPPQYTQPTAQQWNRMQQQGVNPADIRRGVYPPPMPMPGNPKKKRGFRWQLIKFLLVLILVGAVGGGIYIGKAYLDVKPYTSVFLDGVSVDGIDLGGMTWEQGNEAVRSQISQDLGSWYIRLKNDKGTYPDITAEKLNIRRDPTQALEDAWAVGHDTDDVNRKTVFELQQELQEAKANTYRFSSVAYDADTSPIDTIVASLAQGAYIAPQDARMISFNPDSITEPFTFQPEVVGRKLLDADALKAQILEMVSSFESGEIMMQTEAIMPETTVADLHKLYALRGRAVTPIDSHSSEARNENIKNAFRKINNLILDDRDKFSFNGVVGRRTLENGFFHAYEYNYGDLTIGIGGGVCQASTTVYLAAMQAGLELLDHTPHSEKVSYTDLGMDATVVDTRGAEKDMVFRNNSGGQIFIAAHVQQDPANRKRFMCEVRIYGPDLGDTIYKLTTEQVKVLQPSSKPRYYDDEDGEHVTYTDEIEKRSDATVGYVYDTYRDTYVNGELVDRDKLTTSTYPARSESFWRGVTKR